jgi:hypothetical protein
MDAALKKNAGYVVAPCCFGMGGGRGRGRAWRWQERAGGRREEGAGGRRKEEGGGFGHGRCFVKKCGIRGGPCYFGMRGREEGGERREEEGGKRKEEGGRREEGCGVRGSFEGRGFGGMGNEHRTHVLGGMTNNKKITYPRSELFSETLNLDDYMHLTSCADLNTHKKNDFDSEFYFIGKKCMGFIDMDR